jgi:hypothetical protein
VNEPLYVARAVVTHAGALHRRAGIATGATADFGVHGPIRELFKLTPGTERPLPVDYIVAAAGG